MIAPAPVPGSLSWGAVLYPGEGGDAITIRTQAAGTCTAVVYNGEDSIKQIA